MSDKEDIKKAIKGKLPFLRQKYHVETLGIFGSFARDEQTPESDIDIVVKLEAPIGFFDFIRLEKFLSETLNRQVDLVTEKALKPVVKEYISKEIIYV